MVFTFIYELFPIPLVVGHLFFSYTYLIKGAVKDVMNHVISVDNYSLISCSFAQLRLSLKLGLPASHFAVTIHLVLIQTYCTIYNTVYTLV